MKKPGVESERCSYKPRNARITRSHQKLGEARREMTISPSEGCPEWAQGPRRRGKSGLGGHRAPTLEASLLVCRDHTEVPLGIELSLPCAPHSHVSTHSWLEKDV